MFNSSAVQLYVALDVVTLEIVRAVGAAQTGVSSMMKSSIATAPP